MRNACENKTGICTHRKKKIQRKRGEPSSSPSEIAELWVVRCCVLVSLCFGFAGPLDKGLGPCCQCDCPWSVVFPAVQPSQFNWLSCFFLLLGSRSHGPAPCWGLFLPTWSQEEDSLQQRSAERAGEGIFQQQVHHQGQEEKDLCSHQPFRETDHHLVPKQEGEREKGSGQD